MKKPFIGTCHGANNNNRGPRPSPVPLLTPPSEGAFGGPARNINGKQTDTVLKYGLN